MKMLNGLAYFISLIIDSRSRFTARHSAGVAKSSELLGSLMGLSKTEIFELKIAGYLHDIGKLAIPTELLEKPSALTPNERALIKSHVYGTYQILRQIKGLESITQIAVMHHERNNGHGYPFGKTSTELSTPQKIMEIADVFTALAEDRPYRPALEKQGVLNIIEGMIKNDELDRDIFSVLANNYDVIWEKVKAAQSLTEKNLSEFWAIANGNIAR